MTRTISTNDKNNTKNSTSPPAQLFHPSSTLVSPYAPPDIDVSEDLEACEGVSPFFDDDHDHGNMLSTMNHLGGGGGGVTGGGGTGRDSLRKLSMKVCFCVVFVLLC